jgi:phytoene dehydrogenase-like protein
VRQLARAHARDPRLQVIIERFATYAGADPRRAPAALALAGYVEHAFGAWHPRGGLYELVLALARRLQALGGRLRLGVGVEAIHVRHGRVRGVQTPEGESRADAVVAAVDEALVRRQLQDGGPRPRTWPRGRFAQARSGALAQRSLSGLAVMLGLRGRTSGQPHHLIRFPRDYDAEFDDVFARARPVRDPAIYVCAPGATDRSGEPPDGEAWFVLVNAPAIPDGPDWAGAEAAIIERLGVGERVVVSARRTPADLERKTGALAGAIYGAAPHGRIAGLRRPGFRVPGVEGLWLAGGTVHPGGGLPLVALGGRAVARELTRG